MTHNIILLGFDFNLAHVLGFGEVYEIWRSDDIHHTRDARSKVSCILCHIKSPAGDVCHLLSV